MYRVEVTSKGDYRFNVKSKDAEIAVDAKGQAMTPPDVLLASLGSCMGVYIRKYAEGAKLPINDFTVTVEADLGKQSPYYFRQIKAVLDLKGAALDAKRVLALLDFIKNCPVHNTLKNPPEIDVQAI
jgi:putative redox protein